jgi:hypothetical protein
MESLKEMDQKAENSIDYKKKICIADKPREIFLMSLVVRKM